MYDQKRLFSCARTSLAAELDLFDVLFDAVFVFLLFTADLELLFPFLAAVFADGDFFAAIIKPILSQPKTSFYLRKTGVRQGLPIFYVLSNSNRMTDYHFNNCNHKNYCTQTKGIICKYLEFI